MTKEMYLNLRSSDEPSTLIELKVDCTRVNARIESDLKSLLSEIFHPFFSKNELSNLSRTHFKQDVFDLTTNLRMWTSHWTTLSVYLDVAYRIFVLDELEFCYTCTRSFNSETLFRIKQFPVIVLRDCVQYGPYYMVQRRHSSWVRNKAKQSSSGRK